MKPGAIEKEGFAVRAGRVFVALAEVQPSRLPELKDVQEKVKADLVEEKAFAEAAAPGRRTSGRGAETTDLEKAAVALSLVRKESPALVGRGQPLGDLGSGAALEDVAFSLPEKTLSEPVRVATGYAVLRVLEKKAFDPEAFARERGPARRLPEAAEAGAALPGLSEPGPRSLHDRAEGRRLQARDGAGTMSFHVEVRPAGDVVIVDLKGKLTAGLGDQILRETVDELLAEGGSERSS